MSWSEEMQRGFALGALVCEDRGAELACAGLSADVREGASALSRQLAAGGSRGRRAFVRQLLEGTLPAELPEATPPRALALLAAGASREIGRRWLAKAPLPRPGYVAPDGLVRVLRTLASANAAARSGREVSR